MAANVAKRLSAASMTAVIGAAAAAGVVFQGQYPVNDNAMFEYAARALVHGRTLYRDVWDNKLPGVYYVDAVWQTIFGQHYLAHAIAEVLVALASAVLLALLVQSFGLRGSGAAAAILAVDLCVVAAAYGQSLNATETYALLFMIASALAARRGAFAASGVLVGVAALFWIPSLLMTFPLLILKRPKYVWQGPAATLIVIIIAAAVMFYTFGSTTMLLLLRSWVAYVSSPAASSSLRGITGRLWVGAIASGAAPLLAFAFATLRKPATEAQRFAVCWVLAMLAGTCAGTHFFAHYFIPSVAALAFTLAAFDFAVPWNAARVSLLLAGGILAVFMVRYVVSISTITHERSSIVSRIERGAGTIVSGKLTIAVDAYQPGLYLALDPRLRSPYEIAAVANARFDRAGVHMAPADVSIYVKSPASGGIAVCTRSAAPWRMRSSSAVALQFSGCP